MTLPYNRNLKQTACTLRNNMTDAERKLWKYIRKKQINNLQFYRQKVIGHYIVDFYCYSAKLVIEVDGGQHYEEEGLEYEEKRDDFLEGLGLKVIRFSNLDVLRNIDGVIKRVVEQLPRNPR